MRASHDSELFAIAPYPVSRWCASFLGGLMLACGLCALAFNMEFLRLLGLGLPAVISGATLLTLRTWVGEGELRACFTGALVVIIAGLWTMSRVLGAGGEPSILLWVARVLFAFGIFWPIVPETLGVAKKRISARLAAQK